jgi:hypothetical protein
MNLPTTRAQAKAEGSKHYATGKPCNHGHIALRFTSIGKCMACARVVAMSQHVHTTSKRRQYNNLESFVRAANKVHNSRYVYHSTEYTNAHTPLKITCMTHGEFLSSPTNHMQGKGCPLCANASTGKKLTKSTEKFIEEAQLLWGGKFDYSEVVYIHAKADIQFRCTLHPERLLSQQPTNHLAKMEPCTKCNHRKSEPQERITKFLATYADVIPDAMGICEGKSELDVYIPSAKLAVEFHGMWCHSHFTAEDEKKDKLKSYNKYLQCAEKGIRLITIYQTEWEHRQPQIKRLLKNAIGKTKGKVMARKCQAANVPHVEAKEFYEKYHPQGGAGNGAHYGLYWKGKLVACMRFSLGTNDRGNTKNRDWTLARYATRVNVLGGASRLFKAFVKEQDPELIKSFSDNRYFSGGMYEQLGFNMVQDSVPDYQVWSNKLGLLPKTHYQRRVLQKRLVEHGKDEVFDHTSDPRTEKDMTYLMGAGRIYDCGKKKWVWTKK